MARSKIKNPIIRACPICGKAFEVKPYHKDQKACGRVCASAYNTLIAHRPLETAISFEYDFMVILAADELKGKPLNLEFWTDLFNCTAVTFLNEYDRVRQTVDYARAVDAVKRHKEEPQVVKAHKIPERKSYIWAQL